MHNRPLPTTIDDSDRYYFGSSPVCKLCRHRIGADYLACSAFPRRIPLEIWNGERNHNTAYPGDQGIRFEPMPDADRIREQQLAAEAEEWIETMFERVRARRDAARLADEEESATETAAAEAVGSKRL